MRNNFSSGVCQGWGSTQTQNLFGKSPAVGLLLYGYSPVLLFANNTPHSSKILYLISVSWHQACFSRLVTFWSQSWIRVVQTCITILIRVMISGIYQSFVSVWFFTMERDMQKFSWFGQNWRKKHGNKKWAIGWYALGPSIIKWQLVMHNNMPLSLQT